MRTLAIAGMLAMCVVFPAAAQRGNNAPAYEVCQRMAANNSLIPGQHGYTEFMTECAAGKVGNYHSPR